MARTKTADEAPATPKKAAKKPAPAKKAALAKKAAPAKEPAPAKKTKPRAETLVAERPTKQAAGVMTRPTGQAVEDYLAAIEDADRRRDVEALHALITKTAPNLAPKMWGTIIGYGAFHYKYASGREGDWFVLGLASNKSSISVYACATKDGEYVPERHAKALAPANVGRSCIRFKRLAQLELGALERVLVEAAKSPSPAM